MKRILSFFLLTMLVALLLLPAQGYEAHAAEERYAVAADPDVWFYESADESGRLFLLPHTYYVKVRAEGEVYTSVEYLVDETPYRKIYGYCRTDSLLFVDYVPERPYLKQEITVSYSNNGGASDSLGSFDSYDRTFVYYGHRYEDSKLWYYVYSVEEDKFGTVAAESELIFDYNTDYLDFLAAQSASGGEASKTSGGLSAVEIVVICVACVAAVAIAVLVLRGKKPPVPEEQPEF